jgi:hypothetical protein
LRLLGVPIAVLAMLAAFEVSVEPVRYPAVTGERVLTSATQDAIQRSDPIELVTTAVGLAWPHGGSGDAALRVSGDGVDWGPWVPVHADGHGPDRDSGEEAATVASEAVYTGGARWVQVQWEGETEPTLQFVDTSGFALGLADRLSAQLGRIAWSSEARVMASPDQPEIRPRSAWGGQDCVAEDVEYSTRTRVEVLMVHHTIHAANSNAYAPGDVADLLYAICSYHVDVRGWHDIGYNTLIDSSGRIWEGRGGGLDQPVRGAHAAGFNSTSVGVAFIGDHNVAPPTSAAQDAFVAYGAWRLDVAHVDPHSSPVVISRDSPTYPDGVAVPLRAISGHRDVGTTGCPGSVGYNLIGALTERIAQVDGERLYGGWPSVDPIPGNRVEGYAPTEFEFSMTSESDWVFELRSPDGDVIISDAGTGTAGSVPWTPDASFDWGVYAATVEAAPLSGEIAHRPARFEFVLGDFSPPFFDDEESPHEDAIDHVEALGLTTGCSDLRFCPLGDVERWQMALFLTRFWAMAGMEPMMPEAPVFSDIGEYPQSTQSAIEELAALGLTSGVAADLFDPAGRVTRWEMALFLDRTVTLLGVEFPDTDQVEEGVTFADIADRTPEVIDAVSRIAALGITTGTSAETFEPDGLVTREQMAAFLSRTVATLADESPSP